MGVDWLEGEEHLDWSSVCRYWASTAQRASQEEVKHCPDAGRAVSVAGAEMTGYPHPDILEGFYTPVLQRRKLKLRVRGMVRN